MTCTYTLDYCVPTHRRTERDMNTAADNMVRISCDCTACAGKAALVSPAKARGMTAVMAHNYVSYVGGPLGAAMGVFPVVG